MLLLDYIARNDRKMLTFLQCMQVTIRKSKEVSPATVYVYIWYFSNEQKPKFSLNTPGKDAVDMGRLYESEIPITLEWCASLVIYKHYLNFLLSACISCITDITPIDCK